MLELSLTLKPDGLEEAGGWEGLTCVEEVPLVDAEVVGKEAEGGRQNSSKRSAWREACAWM